MSCFVVWPTCLSVQCGGASSLTLASLLSSLVPTMSCKLEFLLPVTLKRIDFYGMRQSSPMHCLVDSRICPFPPSRMGCMTQARTKTVTLDGVWRETRLRKRLAFRMWPDLVPPSGVVVDLSHLISSQRVRIRH